MFGMLLVLSAIGFLALGLIDRFSIHQGAWFIVSILFFIAGLSLFSYGAGSEEKTIPTEPVQPPKPLEPKPETHVVKEETVRKEVEVIVKMRCRYCNYVYDETLDCCPHCGAKR
jgi:hypothetical protein